MVAAQPIPRHSFVCEYVGERISSVEARTRLAAYDALRLAKKDKPHWNLEQQQQQQEQQLKQQGLCQQLEQDRQPPEPGGHALLVRLSVCVCVCAYVCTCVCKSVRVRAWVGACVHVSPCTFQGTVSINPTCP